MYTRATARSPRIPRGVYTLLEEKDAARSTHAAKPAPGRIACPQSRRPARRRAKLETPAIGACRAIRAAAALAGSLANAAAGQKVVAARRIVGCQGKSPCQPPCARSRPPCAQSPQLRGSSVRRARSHSRFARLARSRCAPCAAANRARIRARRRLRSLARHGAASRKSPVLARLAAPCPAEARSLLRSGPKTPATGELSTSGRGPKTTAVRAVSTSGRGPKGARAAPRQTARHVA